MPVISDLSLDSVEYNPNLLTLIASGIAFSEIRADTGKLQYRKSGDISWIEVDSYNLWSDSIIIGVLTSNLVGGNYECRVINGDGEISNILNFNVLSDKDHYFTSIIDGELVSVFKMINDGCNSYLAYIDSSNNLRIKYKYIGDIVGNDVVIV